jgi:hypothetical protein
MAADKEHEIETLSGSCEPQLNERAVKLLLHGATASSALRSMLFYPANDL